MHESSCTEHPVDEVPFIYSSTDVGLIFRRSLSSTKVEVSVCVTEGDLAPSVAKRIQASIEAIGSRILTGKEDSLFLSSSERYNRVLANIVNRVVVGYVVAGIDVDYGPSTSISVTLQPIGQIVQSVDTDIRFGNLSPEAESMVRQDLTE